MSPLWAFIIVPKERKGWIIFISKVLPIKEQTIHIFQGIFPANIFAPSKNNWPLKNTSSYKLPLRLKTKNRPKKIKQNPPLKAPQKENVSSFQYFFVCHSVKSKIWIYILRWSNIFASFQLKLQYSAVFIMNSRCFSTSIAMEMELENFPTCFNRIKICSIWHTWNVPSFGKKEGIFVEVQSSWMKWYRYYAACKYSKMKIDCHFFFRWLNHRATGVVLICCSIFCHFVTSLFLLPRNIRVSSSAAVAEHVVLCLLYNRDIIF